MAVRLRLKRLGRKHRPFFRICAMDARTPRDGRVIEELGHYDPMVRDADARAVLNGERIDYWLSVGALPTEKVSVLIKKYGTGGTHVDKNKQALERLKAAQRARGPVFAPMAPPPKPKAEPASEQPAAEQAAGEQTSEQPAETETAQASATEQSSE